MSSHKLRNRIARYTKGVARTLPAFEAHEREPRYSIFENWRSITWLFQVGEFGVYECLDCGSRHYLPGYDRALVCPHLSAEEATKRAIGFIDLALAKAKGALQYDAEDILATLAKDVAHWARYYPRWGQQVFAKSLCNAVLGPYMARDNKLIPDGHKRQLTDEEALLIVNHISLVRKLAMARATNFGREGRYFNDVLYSDLEEVGFRALEAAIERFDPTRGVTFGAFVEKRLAGEMDDWLSRERIRTVNGNAIVMGGDLSGIADDRRDSKPPKRYRSSTGGYREKPYISTAVRCGQHLIPTEQATRAALAKLNPKQRAVYRGRVLANPPISREVLAKELGIKDPVQISRIERQIRNKLKKLD